MYYRDLETKAGAKEAHDKAQASIASDRMKKIAARKKKPGTI